MNQTDALTLARTLLDSHGLSQIPIGWNHRKCSAGMAHFLAGECTQISLSLQVTLLSSRESVTDTILHEIAHAKAGRAAGHGLAWKLAAMEIGARPTACDTGECPQPKGRYFGTCPTCAQEVNKYRRPIPGARYICVSCKRKGIRSFIELQERVK